MRERSSPHRAIRYATATALTLIATGVGLLLLLDRLFPFPVQALRRGPATVIEARDGRPLRIFLPADGRWRMPVGTNDVAPVLVRTILASEDRWFYSHPGFNPLAVLRAAWANVRAHRVVSGASTIPMQIARMARPRRRTLRAKAIEALRAMQLVRLYCRNHLLELYLNLTPYGGNIEGVGAATYVYFGKRAADLSLGEAALLAVLPRSPNAYDPVRHPAAARAVRDRLLRRLATDGVVTAAEAAGAMREPLPTRRRRAPFLAPHFARYARRRHPRRAVIRTTIDRRTQRLVMSQVAGRIGTLQRAGIGNAAVVVIENDSRAVRAMVGSGGFFDRARQGQVNGALARRSPGSTLKPFLYALAIERGLIVPATYLLDLPTDYAGDIVKNYDGRYRGRVTANEALVRSLNAPAVRLLARVGVSRFRGLLQRGGLSTLDRPAKEYGLSLVLGGAEVTLLDLTNLYASLAEEGVYRPVRCEPGPVPRGVRLFSRATADLITGMLLQVRRPDMPGAWQAAIETPSVAWKTGTSHGYRDAWAVGYSGRYTIGVWVGSFAGHADGSAIGARDAAPLLFDLFSALGDTQPARAAPAPSIEVCADSHQLPGPFCPRRARVRYLPGRTRLHRCTVHRRIFIDRKTGELLSGRCLAQRPHRSTVVSVYPTELTGWWKQRGQAAPGLPPLSHACRGTPAAGAPRIVSPSAATPYQIRRGVPRGEQQVALIARAAAGVRQLYWYQDGRLVGAAAPGTPLFVPLQAGRHRIAVLDDRGAGAGTWMRVAGVAIPTSTGVSVAREP